MINNTNETRDYMNFGDHLFRVREERHMTRSELAEKIGLSDQRLIYDYESRVKFPTFKRFVAICVTLGVSMDSMVE